MKFSLLSAVVGTVACAGASLPSSEAKHMSFERYLKEYGKAYSCAKKRAAARAAFEHRAALIDRHNRLYKEGKTLYEMEFNRWTDVPKSVLDSYMGYEHRDLKHAGYGPAGAGATSAGGPRSLHKIDGVIRKEHLVAPHDEEIGMPCHHHSSRGYDVRGGGGVDAEELRAMRKFSKLPRHGKIFGQSER